jgi:2-phospho-L-lactate guanylyltransferase
MWIALPVKPFAFAKQRLAAVLSDGERATLARVMLLDLLETLRRCTRVSGVLVVSQEPALARLAREFGFHLLVEEARGLSRAVTQAGEWLLGKGESGMLMLPGDVPLATAAEIDTLIAAHGPVPAVSAVADREGFGTNALAVSPPDCIGFHFGRESFAAHRLAALAAGCTPLALSLPGIAFDIDTPDDLRDLIHRDTEIETLAYLCDAGLPARLLPRQQVQSAW